MKKRPKTGFFPGARVFNSVRGHHGTVTKIRAAGRKFPVCVEWDGIDGPHEYTAIGGIVPSGQPSIFLLPGAEQTAPTRFYPGARVVWHASDGDCPGVVLEDGVVTEEFPIVARLQRPWGMEDYSFSLDGRFQTHQRPTLALALPRGWIAGHGLGSKSAAAAAYPTPEQVAYILDEPPAGPAEEIPDLGNYAAAGAAVQAEIDRILARVPSPPDGTEDKKSEIPILYSAPCSPHRLFQAGDKVKVKGRAGVHEVGLNPKYPLNSEFPYIVPLLNLIGVVENETFTDTGHWTFASAQEDLPPVLELAVPAPPPPDPASTCKTT